MPAPQPHQQLAPPPTPPAQQYQQLSHPPRDYRQAPSLPPRENTSNNVPSQVTPVAKSQLQPNTRAPPPIPDQVNWLIL